MLLIDINNVYKSIGPIDLLESISFKLYKDDKSGIVGVNGSGKSTLIKIITGEIKINKGNVNTFGKIGYLPQNLNFSKNLKVRDFIKNIFDYNEFLKILNRFEIKLNELLNQNINTLSGGEKTKLYLAKIIANEPDILLLDEPTNNLDWQSIEIVEEYINQFKGGVLLISHDRHFLDNVVTEIYELDNKKLTMYNGNFSFYANEKKLKKEKAKAEYEEYKKKKKKLMEAAQIQMQRANKYNDMSKDDFQRHKSAKIAKRSKAIISRLEDIDIQERPFKPKEVNMKIDSTDEKTSTFLVRGTNISKTYDKTIFKNLSFQIKSGNRIALIGKNGSGKSTLLKAILGIENVNGEISISPSAKIGYFSQEIDTLNWENTILEELKQINIDETYIRTMLGAMLFRRDDVYKNIKDLSFGEKVRVAFTKLVMSDNNLLLLDEPTNFLDIPTREAVEEALINYSGTILFVSHDRYFVNEMAKEVWSINDGTMTVYLGDYKYYLSKRNSQKKSEHNINEKILALEMKLSHLSFKLLSCSDEEKEVLDKKYFQLAKDLTDLKNIQSGRR